MLKTVHLNRQKDELPSSSYDLRKLANEKEKSGDVVTAIHLYRECIKRMPKDELCYNRLMILYRKQKAYKKEIAIVKTAIKVYEKLYSPKKQANRQMAALSKSISKATGLTDKKGIPLFDRQPVAKWKKRLQFLLKRLKE